MHMSIFIQRESVHITTLSVFVFDLSSCVNSVKNYKHVQRVFASKGPVYVCV